MKYSHQNSEKIKGSFVILQQKCFAHFKVVGMLAYNAAWLVVPTFPIWVTQQRWSQLEAFKCLSPHIAQEPFTSSIMSWSPFSQGNMSDTPSCKTRWTSTFLYPEGISWKWNWCSLGTSLMVPNATFVLTARGFMRKTWSPTLNYRK